MCVLILFDCSQSLAGAGLVDIILIAGAELAACLCPAAQQFVLQSTHTWQAVERAGTAVSRTLNSQSVACMLSTSSLHVLSEFAPEQVDQFSYFFNRPIDLIQIFC